MHYSFKIDQLVQIEKPDAFFRGIYLMGERVEVAGRQTIKLEVCFFVPIMSYAYLPIHIAVGQTMPMVLRGHSCNSSFL